MASDVIASVKFGAREIPPQTLLSGWARPEARFTWSIGTKSVFRLRCPQKPTDKQIELSVVPFLAGPSLVAQRVEVYVNGVEIGSEVVNGPTCIGFRLPIETFGDAGDLTVGLLCPDATAPASIRNDTDARQLALMFLGARVRVVGSELPFTPQMRPPVFATRYSNSEADRAIVRGLTALSAAELAQQFESLGVNCEFGLFQRRCGVEPLGLLRFAGLHYVDLVEGLACGFEGIDSPEALSCYQCGDGANTEWMVRCEPFGLEFHTWRRPQDIPADMLLAEQRRGLAFRRAKLLELLFTGEKLFVVYRPQGITMAQVLPLIAILRSFGPNSLVFASAHTGLPPGSIHTLAPDLFCGSIDGVVHQRDGDDALPNDTWLGDAAFTSWLSICANAYRVWREGGGGLSR